MNRPIVVAEIGINHNGSLEIAKGLIAMAKNFGCDYVKFQKKTPELCVPQSQKNIMTMTQWGCMPYLEYKNKMEFGKREYSEIDKYCRELGIDWFASAWDCKSVNFLMRYDVPYIKIASASIVDNTLLESVKMASIPVIMSTGMSTKEQIDEALGYLGNQVTYLLHCVSSYPTQDEDMNMESLRTLKELYGSRYKIGFSNHSAKIIYTVQAYVMGAEMLEIHITLDRDMVGSDHMASIGPVGLDRIMKHLDSIHKGWGDGEIRCLDSEILVRDKLRVVS